MFCHAVLLYMMFWRFSVFSGLQTDEFRIWVWVFGTSQRTHRRSTLGLLLEPETWKSTARTITITCARRAGGA
ncbi:hypothetical protein FB451DRAFT_1253065 [Mycena latifolia]|nr:hypothetical protein FB451DRAFT_1253065 [Mycena latifolia]